MCKGWGGTWWQGLQPPQLGRNSFNSGTFLIVSWAGQRIHTRKYSICNWNYFVKTNSENMYSKWLERNNQLNELILRLYLNRKLRACAENANLTGAHHTAVRHVHLPKLHTCCAPWETQMHILNMSYLNVPSTSVQKKSRLLGCDPEEDFLNFYEFWGRLSNCKKTNLAWGKFWYM